MLPCRRSLVSARTVACLVMLAGGIRAEPTSSHNGNRLEPGVLPVLAGDSDVGLKLGAFGQLARFHDDLRPYAWRAQMLADVSVRDGATGIESPYREASFKFDWPHAGMASLRLQGELSYLQTTNYGYYGLGNASRASRVWAEFAPGSSEYTQARHYYQYDGYSPQVKVSSIEQLSRAWQRYGSIALSRNGVRQYEGSLLAHDVAQGPGGGQTLFGTGDQTSLLLGLGVAYDSRDHETVTTRGQFHEFSIRVNPGAFSSDAYLGANLTLRGYVPISGELLSLAGRAVGDVVSRKAPLFELSRYGGLYGGQGPGGSRGIRGVPQGRLMGRTKVITNLEVRSLFLPFSLGSQHFCIGMTAFVDAGRVWTEPLQSVTELDGPAGKFHWGAGAGPRFRWGDSLLIRADVAYAPLGAALDAAPAIYVDVDQVL